ncbi:sulfotransferase [Poseidonocella sedimentorum]|uniref:Sulfotransferase domain-containing protein n=1 Tax=Poseidonocella sedimentorum TaxID=871652 RepID=A0A1I6DVZ3_9RHOB|nr:sulfotransferase [Poseidonocella sedimentorum]SFR09501.1 Sulfotransferase domain-containing protein [Poseidonocella sedimentorum]
MMEPAPLLLGIGAQKSATSWVHAVLGAHPDIAPSRPKEVDFYSYYFDRGYAWYDRHFEPRAGQTRFEVSPSYLHDPRAARRARAHRPDTRVIALLRDPVERAFSNHLHEVIKGHIPPVPFAEGLANNPAYVEQGFYARHLIRWMDAFPRGQICVLLAEEIAAEPLKAARRVYEFAGIAPDYLPPALHERRNESDRAAVPLLRSVLRAGGDAMRRGGLEPVLSRAKALGPVRALLKANSVDMRQEVPPMDAVSRARLDALFRDDLAQLARLLSRDSFPWGAWERQFGASETA